MQGKMKPSAASTVERAKGTTRTPESTAEQNSKQAIVFLKGHSDGWATTSYLQVVAIVPDGPITTRAVHPDRIDDLRPFIEQHNGKANLYFATNPLHRDPGKKASKVDIAALAYHHVDLDPAVNESPEAAKQRHRKAVATLSIEPSTLIDSGNGLGAFWRLQEPIEHDGNTDALEQINRRLAQALGGDSCHNIDRVMRLPGTVNLPTATKLAKGRIPVPATLIRQTAQAYGVGTFSGLPAVAEEAKADMPPTSVGTPIRLDDYGLPDDQAALVAGTLPKGKRSEGMHGLTVGLLDDGHSRDDVLATLHEEPNLAEYFTSKHPGDPAKFALAELEKAWAKSWQGILARLAPYNSAWAQPDAVTIRAFAGMPVLNEKAQPVIRFDAKATTLDELDAEDPPQQYVIEPIFPLGVPGEFAGAHGIGKSINGAEQCCCVATGRDWQGLSVTQGKAVFASWEDPRSQIMRRVKTWLRNITDPMERARAKRAIAENLTVLGCDEIDLMLTAKAFGVCSVRDEVIELIAERCQGTVLVMLETAALMHGGDELNEDLAQLAKAVKLITKATGAAVITVRHVSKDAARNKVVDAYVGRGGGSFTGAMRTMVVLVDVPAEDVRRKCIGFGNAAVVTGRPVLAYHHVKANYGDKMKEPVYLAVMPDGHMERVTGPDERQAHSDRLLEWLRDNVPAEGMSYTKIRGASKKHGVKQDMVRVMLEMLKSAGHITNRQVSCQGGKGTAETWYLTEQV
ncbi:AAA family ATPase [Pseudomonas sp. BEA3.1]|uniref:AAA family ATPase n=1 Tax=Pseudomonas sp. BEA3.1 TaxID=3083251 RepID=UPI0029654803|nr:AAA family ATPase [Pseudomonas sp. BEA3.1]MDW2777432.1 AAA family ATPase [Pseudomonas sp. BEA3.1]